MLAHFAANAVVFIHLAFIVFVLFGAGFVLRWKWVAWLHVPAFVWGATVEFLGTVCPLTPLEQRLREVAGEQGYGGGFVDHYIIAVMYPAGLTVAVQWWLGMFVVAVNVVIYAFVVARALRTAP